MPKLSRLKTVRERRALSQGELAQRAGISRSALIAIEHCDAEPRPSTVRKLAVVLAVSPAELMEPDPSMEPRQLSMK